MAACLLVGAFTEVSRVVHLLSVRHVACPYDGVLVHEEDLPAEARASSELLDSAGVARQASVAPRHEHDQCAGVGAVDRPCVLAAIPGPPAIRAGQATTPPLPPVSSGVARPVLSYAPKLPPPV